MIPADVLAAAPKVRQAAAGSPPWSGPDERTSVLLRLATARQAGRLVSRAGSRKTQQQRMPAGSRRSTLR
jgi:hypothetical protein